MAAPVPDKIILPGDTGNTGKNVRTQTRVVNGFTVHEHYFIPISARSRTGIYFAHSNLLTIPTAAHNPTASAYFWFVNPAASGVKVALRRFRATMQFAAMNAVDVSVPRQALALITATGVPSGAALVAGKHDSQDAAPQAAVRTAMTGLTITPGAIIRSELPPINPTATSATIQGNMLAQIGAPWDLEEDEMPVLRAGEGIVFYSADAGTTANRRMIADLIWEEFE